MERLHALATALMQAGFISWVIDWGEVALRVEEHAVDFWFDFDLMTY